MIIKEVLQELEGREQPLAKALFKGEHFKALVLGFKKGMALKEHVAHLPSKLVVLSGAIVYRQEQETILHTYDEMVIPVNVPHAVEALEDSVCLLLQGV